MLMLPCLHSIKDSVMHSVRLAPNSTRSPAVAKIDGPYFRRLVSDFRSRKAISKCDYSLWWLVTLLHRTLQSKLIYDTVIRCTWVMSACRNFAFKIAVKPVPSSPTPYDVRFSHNTCAIDRQRRPRTDELLIGIRNALSQQSPSVGYIYQSQNRHLINPTQTSLSHPNSHGGCLKAVSPHQHVM